MRSSASARPSSRSFLRFQLMSLVVSARERAAEERVEARPEEGVDPALDVDEDEQHGGEPVEEAVAGVRRR